MKKTPCQQRAFDDYGFTHDDADVESVRQWVRDAIADGWDQRTYFDGEPVDQACRLSKDGFRASVLTRTGRAGRYPFEASIAMWGPDGMVISVPRPYDGEAIRKALQTCNICAAYPITPRRYSFAGRCCDACLSMARQEYERPGWDN